MNFPFLSHLHCSRLKNDELLNHKLFALPQLNFIYLCFSLDELEDGLYRHGLHFLEF